MNDDPQLIIFEPLKKPRTVVLKVLEDSGTDSATIFDENGRTVTNYNVLYDESKSATANPDKEKIFAYIENWELQNGEIVNTEKQTRKIEKRKRLQAAKNRKKERNKKRKAAMKSLIHCAFDADALSKTKDIQEERAILQAMKMQNLSIKNVLNLKKKTNGHINLNTNYRPFENSVIELGRRKTPIDVVNLDSDEESESDDDDIQINIDPPPQTQRRNRIVDFSNDQVIRDGSPFLTSDSNTRKRRNKNVEVVQIVDSSDSDVECLSNGPPSVESLSDDDNNSCDNSTTQNTQSDCPANSNTVQDEEISPELNNLVDNFVNRYIQNVMPILTDTTSPMETEHAAPQLLITEPISLQPASSLPSKKSKKRKDKHVAFDNPVQDTSANDDELVIVENEPPQDEPIDVDSNEEQVQADEQAEVEDSLEKNESISDDSMEFNDVSEDEDHCSPKVIDYDSIPSPDYTPIETIPATASNLKAFADFIRSQKERDEQNEEDKSCFEVPKSTPSVTERKRKSSNQCHSPPHSTPYTSKKQSHPWSKRCSEKSDDIVEVDEDPTNQQQQQQQHSKPRQKRCNDTSKDSVEIEYVASIKPCQNDSFNKSDEIEIIEDPPMSSSEPQSFPKEPAVTEIDRSEKFSQGNLGQLGKNLRNSLPNQRPPTQSFQKRKSLPAFDRDTSVGRDCPTPFPSSNRRNFSNRRCPPHANESETNSAVAFFDKNSIRIGESGSKPKNICHNKKPTSAHVNSGRTFYPKTFLQCGDEANEHLQNNSQRAPFNKKPFCQRENRQCGTMPRYENKTPWQCESGSETPVSSARLEKGPRWQYKSASQTPVSIVPPRKQEHWQNESESRASVTCEPYERKIPWKDASKPQLRVENDDENDQHQQQQYRESICHEFHPPNEAVKRNWNHPQTHEESDYFPEKYHDDREPHSLVDNSCQCEDDQPQQCRQFHPRNMPVNRNRNHSQSYEDPNYYSEDVCDEEEQDPQVDKYCQSDQHQSQSQQYCETIHDESLPRNIPANRNRYHPEPYEESKHYPENVRGGRFHSSNRNFHRNRYHPEPYEEQKFIPNFGPAQFQQRPTAWRNQNRTPYRDNRFNRNREYYNGPPNHFNRGGRPFRPRFVPNQGQRYPNRGNMQNMAKFNQPPEGNSQYSNSQQLPCDNETNQYRNQSQSVPSSVPEQSIPEEALFTRRSKFEYKANVSDFDNTNTDNRGPPPYRQNPRNRDQNTNFHRTNDFESYESNVARNLHSSSGNNNFSWENNQACDYVPFDANRPVSSPAPWSHDYSNSDYDPSIKALSRQVWLNDTLNSKT